MNNIKKNEDCRLKIEDLRILSKKQKGFTLIEMLLYLTITVSVLFTATMLFPTMISSRIKNQVTIEVEQQGAFVLNTISRTVRMGDGINFPAPGAQGDSLSVLVGDIAKNPTTFSVNNGTFLVREGSGDNIPLTNSRVEMSNVVFQNLTQGGGREIVRIEFTLSSYNPENQIEYEYSQNFYTSVTVRGS